MQKRIYAIKENALKQYKIIPEHAKKHKLTFIFFHPDYTVGFGISPNHAFRLVGYTTGRELHPALKIVIQLRTIIISDIISVNKKFFSRLSKYNNLQAGKHRLFLNILLFGKLRYPIMGQNVQLERSGRTLLVNGDFQFSLGKKIAIVGENGSGKTTLLEHIRKQGEGILLSPKVSFQVYQQKGYQMTSEESIIRFVMRQTEFSESLVRSLLNHLGFAQETLTKPLCTLSGGEATRLTIALLFTKPSNVLLLDEPTNFIDMATIEALEKLMQIYPGTILFTSHDSYFVERTADEVYEIKGQKIKKVLTRNF